MNMSEPPRADVDFAVGCHFLKATGKPETRVQFCWEIEASRRFRNGRNGLFAVQLRRLDEQFLFPFSFLFVCFTFSAIEVPQKHPFSLFLDSFIHHSSQITWVPAKNHDLQETQGKNLK